MDVLTPSLEDYLEAILTISVKEKVARVKDIAKHLGVSTPSVVSALNVLAVKNLIKHERYGYVELTDQGVSRAKVVDEYHKLLFTLLNEILGVETEIAYKDACKIEHHLSKETVKRIKQFIHFLEEHKEEKALFISRFKQSIEEEEKMQRTEGKTAMITLGELGPGEKGRVVKIKGTGNLRKRLMDMGMIPGTEVQLKKVAPLGDPLEILIKGYHLSLRKDEAEGILITRGKGS
jgi:DtxR family Mn-dependent transcriptional regulator